MVVRTSDPDFEIKPPDGAHGPSFQILLHTVGLLAISEIRGLTFKLYQAYKLSQTDNNRLFVLTIEIFHVISFRLEQNKTAFSQINLQHQKNYLVFSTPVVIEASCTHDRGNRAGAFVIK